MKRFVGIVCAVALVGCSSLRKQADEQFEKGAYEEALTLYDQAVRENPSDADATAGQRKARLKMIDKRLLTVRHTRLGGNAQAALNLLLEVVQDETEWKAFPESAVSSTQDEETEALFSFFRGNVDAAFKKKLPLRARYWIEHYRPVFQGHKQQMLEAMTARATVDGKASCAELGGADEASPYYAQFMAKYCGLWGMDTATYQKASRGKLADLYRKIEATVRLKGIDDGTDKLFENMTEESLRKSPWYDASGAKAATLVLTGTFSRQYFERAETRSHSYQVSIPYTEYQTVTKTRYTAQTTYKPYCYFDEESGQQVCRDVAQTYNEPSTYQEQVPVTRYRYEPRIQLYDGTYETQILSLTVNGRARFGGADRKLSLSDRSKTGGFHHEWSMPSIGLNPESANLEDPDAWLARQATIFGGTALVQASDAWIQLYCRPLAGNADFAAQGNQVHRCLRGKPDEVPAFVTAWYTNHFGITPKQAESLFSLNDF